MAGNQRQNRGGKVANPYLFEESNATLQSLKKWFNTTCNHQKQNDDFLIFFEGEDREIWTAKCENVHRGITIAARQAVVADVAANVLAVEAITAYQAAASSRKIRRDLDTLLNNFATYAPDDFYETIVNEATSIKWIFDRLALYCKLSSDKQFILNSYSIRYDPENGDTPEKLFLRLKAHYTLAAPKSGSTFDGKDIDQDVPINEACLLMLVEQSLFKIDPRLPAHIQATRANLMQDGKTLYCVRRLLWDQVEQMINEMNIKEDLSTSVRFLNSGSNNSGNYAPRKNKSWSNNGSQQSSERKGNFNFKSNGDRKQKLCGACFRAGKPESVFGSHNMTDCNFLSNGEKKKLLQAASRLLTVEEDIKTTDLTAEEPKEADSDTS